MEVQRAVLFWGGGWVGIGAGGKADPECSSGDLMGALLDKSGPRKLPELTSGSPSDPYPWTGPWEPDLGQISPSGPLRVIYLTFWPRGRALLKKLRNEEINKESRGQTFGRAPPRGRRAAARGPERRQESNWTVPGQTWRDWSQEAS